ncbi:PREDICTED: UPF0481 protein At3g47200-like [Fragaria vesca subsp. vesca]|uniref:UPF0481 protein At3g47200-like n=1 Tax=Fragaria vesca subsp. vesca TaxID=101020 RepID=UPI0002C3201B|nr:PREDICTED: UPF0481 protein At3g47200-like [Fragaria vesca subsp. vesca]
MASGNDIEKGQVNGSDSINAERGGINVGQLKFTLNTSLWEADSPLPFSCCIFRVPEVLRRRKVQAYEPDIVSIGPLHRSADPKFKLVEKVKEWYLKCLLERPTTTITLDSLIEGMKELEREARGRYSDPRNDLDQNDFIRMLILDGCFLIELFRKARDESRQDYDDPIFNAPCMLEYLYHDLLLLENQLPWSVLKYFYDLIESGNPGAEPLSKVVIDFFRDSVADPSIFSDRKSESTPEILHIVDLIRTSLVQEHKDEPDEDPKAAPLPSNHLPQRIPSAATLTEAGVTFRIPKEPKAGSPGGCILNITFKDGVFSIPPLAIDERTDPLFRNLMAYEQCYHSCTHKITSYAVLMDNLIDTAKDVDLLCEKGIVANWLSSEDASKFFNDLYDNTTVIDFVYKRLCTRVNDYHRSAWMRRTWIRWKNKLRSDYFDTPWSTISFFAAFVLLVLTFLQTVYTIQQYRHSPN